MKKQSFSIQSLHRAATAAKQAIKNHVKPLILAAALLAGGYAVSSQYLNSNAVGLAFSIGIVARCKKAGITLDEGTETFLKEIDAEVNKAFNEAKEQTITKAEFDKIISDNAEKIAAALDVTKIMVGAGDTAKSLDQMLRDIGDDAAKAVQTAGTPVPKTIFDLIEEKMDEVKAIMTNKKGNITITVKAAATMTTDNTVDYDENAIPPEAMESMSIAAFVPKRYAKEFISEVADRTVVSEIEQYTVWDEEGSIEGAFAEVAEGGLKPLMSGGLVKNFAQAQKVAGKYVFTEEFAKWRKKAKTIIERIVKDQMMRDYNAILTADLNAVAVPYGGTNLDDTFTAPNNYDAIGAVAAQMETFNFFPDTIVLHPQDKWAMRLTKSEADGRYQFPVTTENGETKVFEFRIITSTRQTVGEFTLAESGLFKIEEETLTIRMGYGINVTKDGDGKVTDVQHDIDHNRFRVIVETWFKDWLATPHVGAIVKSSFATVKAALLSPAE